jgi:hypothetical protein
VSTAVSCRDFACFFFPTGRLLFAGVVVCCSDPDVSKVYQWKNGGHYTVLPKGVDNSTRESRVSMVTYLSGSAFSLDCAVVFVRRCAVSYFCAVLCCAALFRVVRCCD